MTSQNGKAFADGRFEIDARPLGEGSFGQVYRGKDTRNGALVAIKVAYASSDSVAVHSLRNEYELLDKLARPHEKQGFATCQFFATKVEFQGKKNTSILVMDLLSSSLEDCMTNEGGKFNVGTTVLVAQQALHRMEYLHSKSIVHRDIKPDNFMLGTGRKLHHLYIIDFGLSTPYWDRSRHATMSKSNSLTGTARYASVNAHHGLTQSRRDDLEAIGHMLLYFLRGSLPWSGLKAKTHEDKFKKIADTKERYSLNELCKGLPDEFKHYLMYCRKLGFKDRPDYLMWQRNFKELRDREKISEDYQLQWINPQSVDVTKLMPHDPGAAPLQPDDVPGRSRPYFSWRKGPRSSRQPSRQMNSQQRVTRDKE